MPWYKSGTVALTLNSTTVTGTGTAFDANVRVGDMFRAPNGATHEITNVASATVISISPAYAGATASGQAYSIVPVQGYPKDLADAFRAIQQAYGTQLGSNSFKALAAIVSAANKLPYFTAVDAMATIDFGDQQRSLLATIPLAPTAAVGTNTDQVATMKALLAGMAALGIGNTGSLPNTLDANAITGGGVFAIPTTANGGVNGPSQIASIGWTIFQGALNSTVKFQIASPWTATAANKYRLFVRQCYSSTWSDWVELANTAYVDAATMGMGLGGVGATSPTYTVTPAQGSNVSPTRAIQALSTDDQATVGAPVAGQAFGGWHIIRAIRPAQFGVSGNGSAATFWWRGFGAASPNQAEWQQAAKAGANSDITSLAGLTTALSIAQGGTGGNTAAAARAALSAAARGANSDITSLNGLTTALSVAQGGTGAATAAAALAALGAAAKGANSDITALSGLTTALSIAQGGTGGNTAKLARDNLSCAGLARTTVALTLPTATLTYATFDTEVMDSAGVVNISTDTTYLTVPEAGLYVLSCGGDIAGVTSPASGSIANLRVVDSAGVCYLLVAAPFAGANANQMAGCGLAYLAAGTKLRMGAYQSSGSSTTLRATASYSGYFGLARVG